MTTPAGLVGAFLFRMEPPHLFSARHHHPAGLVLPRALGGDWISDKFFN
jgi:hypothetical protein